ncbi:MAG: 3-deoxy-7-phosphoheptulonate synthase [Cyanobacteria bacterium J083]|nr:MAG: 3-deoxy-7-phosphoheptulonate synthase [Cyanobacteria bacterium J083]
MEKISDLHVVDNRPLLSPAFLHSELPNTTTATELIVKTRETIREILTGKDRRLLVIVGPCSIHDVAAAREYAEKLTQLRQELSDYLEIVMRVYFEKPRTTIGWKGLINDPHLDGTYDINTGLRLARNLLLDIAELGLPAATELLDPITPQYIADLIAWTAIGARTTESQVHRQMASGLSMPVGFKNSTDGSLNAAVNAMLAAQSPHHFLGINMQGLASIVTTTGNPDTHLVLRGGAEAPNYYREDVEVASKSLQKKNLNYRVMIDCSHGNSDKDYRQQPIVLENVAKQIKAGCNEIIGVMIESHLVSGNQALAKDGTPLVYGQSITDACVDFSTTVKMLRSLADALVEGRGKSLKLTTV